MLQWDHNAYYQRLLLDQLPPRCHRVLDVGCGAGSFATRLADRVEHVDALDRSPVMIERARQHTPDNVTCILGDVMDCPLVHDGYDAIFSISALHHMHLEDALLQFAALLRPGGTLAVIALPRADLRRELPVEVAATLGQRMLGAMFLAARSVGSGDWYAMDSTHAEMPVLDPTLTTREVTVQARAVLPGVDVRRLLFWRYLLRWQKPAD